MPKKNRHTCPICFPLVPAGCSRNAVHANDIAITGGHKMFFYIVAPVPNQLWLQKNTIGLKKMLDTLTISKLLTMLNVNHLSEILVKICIL